MEPTETPYDLRWQMFSIPVRVHPMFWLVTALMGSNSLRLGLVYVALWVVCVFVSILIHELGHVFMGQYFGAYGHIIMYGFGGLAVGSNRLGERWQRIAVCFAGPLAGFVFLAALFAILWISNPAAFPFYLFIAGMDVGIPAEVMLDILPVEERGLPNPLLDYTVGNLIFINLLWGLVNLLPIWPLDGGQISRDACEGVAPGRGLTQSLMISMVVAGVLAAHCFLSLTGYRFLPLPIGSVYTAILFTLLAIQSFQLWQQARAQNQWWDDRWER